MWPFLEFLKEVSSKKFIAVVTLFFAVQLLSMAENDRAFVWSVSPYVSGGVAGVTDSYYSSIRYAGPIAGVGADVSARKDNLHLSGQLFCSYAWLSNRYSLNAAYCTPCKVNIGCDYRIYTGNRLSVYAGGGVGLMGYLLISLPTSRNFHQRWQLK